jgi:hypothetical protein
MIKKEIYITREDGVKLYRTFSDTDHKLRKVADGAIYDEAIDISEGVEYEEVDGYVELEGANTYEEIMTTEVELAKLARKINHIGLTDNEALTVKHLYPKWEEYIGRTIEVEFITLYGDNLWRARQTHTALSIYPPSLDTASLYEVVNEDHEGTLDDPIPYVVPMEIFEGKFYVQYDVVYRCTRSSGTALTHDLRALVGLYVEEVR